MKRISKIALTTVLGLAILLPAVGCGGKEAGCAHNVGTWEITVAPTCEKGGKRAGICGVCLETVTEDVAPDPEAHVYGEWSVVKPTETEQGSATKVCTENTSHVLRVGLPVLNALENYTSSEITKRPSPASDGERTYTLKNDAGEITFTEPIPKTGIQTLRDAVGLGAADESHELIRKAEGQMGWWFFNDTGAMNGQKLLHNHSYELGDNYTHIVDGADNCNRWYFVEDGVTYGLTDWKGASLDASSSGKIYNDRNNSSSNDKYLQGSRMYLQYANYLGYFYGVEELLEGMYRTARWSDNNDFVEEIIEAEDGTKVYSFSFGSAENSGDVSGYFSKIKVEFTLTDVYTVEDLYVEATVYTNGISGKVWDFDENGNAYVIEGKENGTRYVSVIDFSQTLKEEGDVVPQNPHPTKEMYVQSFDVTYHGEIMQEGDVAEFASGARTDYIFAIKNVTPDTALVKYTFDGFKAYLREVNDRGETIDTPIDWNTMTTVGMSFYMKADTKEFYLNAQRAGKQQVVIKTVTGLEKVINCEISEQAPTVLYPMVYAYSDGLYEWITGEESIDQTIYVGQPLCFKSAVPANEERYASAAYNVSVSPSVTGEDTRLIGTSVGGEPATQFTTDKTGFYTITLTSKLDTTKVCYVNVEVKAAPTFAQLTSKVYTQKLEYFGDSLSTEVTVSFEGYKAVNETVEGVSTVVGYEATATVVTPDGTEKLTVTYNVSDGKIKSTHLSGADYGFMININEAYGLVLSHPDSTGYYEEVVLRVKA